VRCIGVSADASENRERAPKSKDHVHHPRGGARLLAGYYELSFLPLPTFGFGVPPTTGHATGVSRGRRYRQLGYRGTVSHQLATAPDRLRDTTHHTTPNHRGHWPG
jgi:hypothetical protein